MSARRDDQEVRRVNSALRFLADIRLFSRLVLGLPLRRYQVEPVRAVLDSVLNGRGFEFLVVFPRQAGKNEAVAQILAYLLNVYKRVGGHIVYGATGDGLGLGIERLEARLENDWNAGRWRSATRPVRRLLGKAGVVFLSTHPLAASRGQTARYLLVVDEAQDQSGAQIEAVFTPMRAAHNATALYIGTVKLSSDFLWQKKIELEREQARDGVRRVFLVGPEVVTAENPAYRQFLDTQVRKHGRQHPIVASEYFLEPIDGSGGLFDARRRALMAGEHAREAAPAPGGLYVATVDVAGEDEAATDPIARLAHPARDYTVATVFRVEYPARRGDASLFAYAPGPTYRAVDVFVDHGSKHFADVPGRPALVHRLAAWLGQWQVAHLVGDESGVGQGLVAWLASALGEHRVTGYNFAGPGKKAALGSLFLALVETGRFRYWADDPASHPAPSGLPNPDGLTDRDWFFAQVAACSYHVPPDGRFDRDLRWEVPAGHKTPTPDGPKPTHDDRLLSAALVAELDRLLRTGGLALGVAESAIIEASDPLANLEF